jgi:cytochrome b subunit of formate dehydrogenase
MAETNPPRHPALLRVTHWLTTVAFVALLVRGVEILILKKVGKGLGSSAPEYGYAWYAGI